MTDAIQDDAPPATFDVLPLSAETRASLERMGYKHPSPVQRAVFAPTTAGKDLVVQARTGTGKTTAFGLPIVEWAIRKHEAFPQVLVLCPTRELVVQVASELRKLGEGRNISPLPIYGGVPLARQVEAFKAGAQLIIGTPGRTLDHLKRGTLDPSKIRLLVLDEADEMLSMGFERELTAILDNLPRERQTLLFSATLPPDIERIARSRLKTPEFLTLSGDHVGALTVSHFAFMVTSDKRGALLQILESENPDSAIVFCNTRPETEALAAHLQRAGYRAEWLNGDLEQTERERVMNNTREGKTRFLVATDVAARGIDISHLTHVINFDFPDSAESYVHRTGRTGRAGRTGTAISLVTPQDVGNLYYLRLTYGIRPFERQVPSPLELKTRAELDLLQTVQDKLIPASIHGDDLSLARRLLSHDRVEAMLAGLLRHFLGPRPEATATAATTRRAKLPAPYQPPPETPVEQAAALQSTPPREPAQRPTPQTEGQAEGRRHDSAPERRDNRRERGPSRHRQPQPPAPASTSAEIDSEPMVSVVEVAAAEVTVSVPVEPAAPPQAATSVTSDEDLQPRRRRRISPTPLTTQPVTAQPAPTAASVGLAATAPSALKEVPVSKPVPPRPAELASWSPPEEEGDDKPILPDGKPTATPDEIPEDTSDFVGVFVDIGRRDGVRPGDLQRVLKEGGLGRRETGKIRIRDRYSLVFVPKDLQPKAIEILAGASLQGRTLRAEAARERMAAEPEVS